MRSTFPLLLLLPSVIILLVGPGIHKAHRRSVGSTAPDQHHQEDEALGQALNGGLADRQGEQQWAESYADPAVRRRRGRGHFQGCGRSAKYDTGRRPESPQQAKLWQALANLQVQFVVSGPWAHPSGGHRISPLIISRHMFEKRNADGVLGFSEVRPHAGLSFFGVVSFLLPRPAQGLAVRQLSPLAPGEPQTLHLPEQLMVQLPHKQPSWSYDTCAIVGNSGRLLHAQHGAEIDSHDAVFRINYAPLEGFEKNVGKRTDFDVINAVHARAFARKTRSHGTNTSDIRDDEDQTPLARHGHRRPSTLVVFEVMNKSAKGYFARLLQAFNGGNPDTHGAVVMAPELVLHSDWLFQASTRERYHSKAMSGWYATMLAVQVCKHTDIYGFSPFVSGEGHWHGRYHYFDTDVQPALQSHSFDMAYAAIREVSLYPCSRLSLSVHLDN